MVANKVGGCHLSPQNYSRILQGCPVPSRAVPRSGGSVPCCMFHVPCPDEKNLLWKSMENLQLFGAGKKIGAGKKNGKPTRRFPTRMQK